MPSIVRSANILAKIGLWLLSYVFMKSLLLMSLNTVCVSDCDITNKIYVKKREFDKRFLLVPQTK